jgi:hypothetical protein
LVPPEIEAATSKAYKQVCENYEKWVWSWLGASAAVCAVVVAPVFAVDAVDAGDCDWYSPFDETKNSWRFLVLMDDWTDMDDCNTNINALMR